MVGKILSTGDWTKQTFLNQTHDITQKGKIRVYQIADVNRLQVATDAIKKGCEIKKRVYAIDLKTLAVDIKSKHYLIREGHVIKLVATLAEVHKNLGNSLFTDGQYPKAIECYTQSIMHQQNYAEAYFNRGYAHQKEKNLLAALQDYTKAIHYKSDYTKAYYNRGIVKKELGTFLGAIQDLESALKFDPANIIIQQSVEDLKKSNQAVTALVALEPKPTKGGGDCAFHAVFGQQNKGMYECLDLEIKRKDFVQIVRNAQKGTDLYNLRGEAIKALIMEGSPIFSKVNNQAVNKYINFEKTHVDSITTRWKTFEDNHLKKHPEIIDWVNDHHTLKTAKPTFKEKFYNCLAKEDSLLQGLLFSFRELWKAYEDYNQQTQEDYDWSEATNDITLITTYCNYMAKQGIRLLPLEVQMIAYAFDLTIVFYNIKLDTPQSIYNPGKSHSVSIHFNGANHYQRMDNSENLPFVSPVLHPDFIQNPAVNDMVAQQLQGLIQICEQLLDPKLASLQTLLNLSWGIGSLPKEKKFSRQWIAVISERHWLLLDDISRQMTSQYPTHPNISDLSEKKLKKLISEFSQEVQILKKGFEILIAIENATDLTPFLVAPERPMALPTIESHLCPGFDRFVLGQVEHNLNIITTALKSQDPIEWLKDPNHVKAMFRTIEVIGEASKILSEEAKKKFPTLMITSKKEGKPLWGKLRNQLHHNKSRSWDIANFAPEKWADLLCQLLPELEKEINDYKSIPQINLNLPKTRPATNYTEILETISELCGQEQFRQVRHLWQQIESNFSEKLILTRFLFGFETIENNDFLKVWETHAKPHLNSRIDANKCKACILEMLRTASGNLIEDNDIEKLTPLQKIFDKESAVAEMKRLLSSIEKTKSLEENKKQARIFEQLADQFVFLQIIPIPNKKKSTATDSKTDPKTNIKRDTKKSEDLRNLMLTRLSEVSDFEFSETLFNKGGDYSELLKSYIHLKCESINQLIKKMKELLRDIENSWPKDEINAINLKAQADPNQKQSKNLKSDFNNCLKELSKQYDFNFIRLTNLGDLKSFTEDLKTFPIGRIIAYFNPSKKQQNSLSLQELTKEIKDIKDSCMKAIPVLEPLLSQIICDPSQIQKQMDENLKNGVITFQNIEKLIIEDHKEAKRSIQTIADFFKDFIEQLNQASKDFIQKFNQANPDKILPKQISHLDSFSKWVLSNFESKLNNNLEVELDKLTSEAKSKLSTPYVQHALSLHSMPDLPDPSEGVNAKQYDVILLGDIYRAGLNKTASDYPTTLLAWENIERKISRKRLSAERIKEVVHWLPSDDKLEDKQKTAKIDLLAYLDAAKSFDLKGLSRFEHPYKKIETFEDFLKDSFFPAFPNLENHKDTLLSYFKSAYGISDTESKAQHFARYFTQKIEKLGKIFSQILNLEKVETDLQDHNRELLFLAAEYDMQDVGELAQLITDRPSLWDIGRHILSPQHLQWISLMRKMMAHYPLLLNPDILRWNLEYLAFDTNNMLSNNKTIAYEIQPLQSTERKPITSQDLSSKMSDIKEHLARLNLDVYPEILYPSLGTMDPAYLHPLGELALMVHPTPVTQSREQFIHALMELELILSYELQAKVSIIGKWENEYIHSFKEHIPEGYLTKLIHKRQPLYEWINSTRYYHFILNNPWSSVTYRFGLVVTRTDFELHHELVFFLNTLDFEVKRSDLADDLQRFVNRKDLTLHIKEILQKQFSQMQPDYSQSVLFRWICCLFERFCLPENTPHHPICLPKSYNSQRPLITMLDNNNNDLLRQIEIQNKHLAVDKIIWDIEEIRSLLDPSISVTSTKLPKLADYAVAVLRAHLPYVLQKLEPRNGLDQAVLKEVVSIRVADPGSEPVSLNEIPLNIQQLIKSEAQNLSREIIAFISEFSNTMGKDFCIYMLEYIEVDKEIEQIARNYYGKNRQRLKGPYMQMDETSRSFFEDQYVKNSKEWVNFPFISCLQHFINRILLESDSFKIDLSSRTPQCRGDLHTNLKALIPESNIQELLLSLMKKSKILMHAFFSNNPSDSDQKYKKYSPKWNALFKMIHSPDVFQVLKSYFQKNENIQSPLKAKIEQDFENQYKTPPAARENTVVSFLHQGIELYDARTYFDGKNNTNQAKQEHDILMNLSEPILKEFSQEWKKQYDEDPSPSSPLYGNTLINEVRKNLDFLISNNSLPKSNFDNVPTYTTYWQFVKAYPVEMTSSMWGSGMTENIKTFMLKGGNFQKLLKDPRKKEALKQNKRLSKLIESYLSFFDQENSFSNLYNQLAMDTKRYTDLTDEKQKAKTVNQKQWRILTYESRLQHAISRLQKRYLRLEEILDEIINTPFFMMLKLSMQRKHLLKNPKNMLSDSEQEKEALQQLFVNLSFTLQDLANILDKAEIPYKKHLKFLCPKNPSKIEHKGIINEF